MLTGKVGLMQMIWNIRIINIYHEREDFMWLLFGIDTTPQETIDYWGK